MKAAHWKFIVILLLVAVFLRLWGAFDYEGYYNDETSIVPNAISLMKYGTTTEWKYPQVNSLIIAGTIKLFGNNPVGWRISGIVLGMATILMLYMVARQLFPIGYAPLIAATLLAFDPFHIHFCRTAMIETPVIFFFLLFLYFMLAYSEKNRPTLVYAGIALGLTIATKAYFVFAIPVVVGYVLYRDLQRRRDRSVVWLEFVAIFAMLPLAIYILSYFQWFGRGYTLQDFFQYRSDAYWVFNHNYQFAHGQILAQGGKPWEWFVKPISFGYRLFSDGEYGRYTIEINNPLFRMMVIPSLCLVLIHGVKQRSFPDILPTLLFTTCYLLFFVVSRPFNSYSALVLLPFAYLILGRAVSLLANRFALETGVAVAFLCMVVLTGCYLFPVTSGFAVPDALYRPILSMTSFSRAF